MTGIPDHILKEILKQQEERKARQNQFYWSLLYVALAYVFLHYVLPWLWSKYREYIEREEMLKALERELLLRREAATELQQRRETVAELQGIVDELSRAEGEHTDVALKKEAFVLTRPSAPVTLAELQRVQSVKRLDKDDKKATIPSVLSRPSEAPRTSNDGVLRRRTGGQVVSSTPASAPVSISAAASPGSGQNPWAQVSESTNPGVATESESRRRAEEENAQAAEREQMRDRKIREQQDRELAASETADRHKAEQTAALELLRTQVEQERQRKEKEEAEEAAVLLELNKEREREDEGKRRLRIDEFYRQIREARACLPPEPLMRNDEPLQQESNEAASDAFTSPAKPPAALSVDAAKSPKSGAAPESPSALDPFMMVPNALLFGVTLGQVNFFASPEPPESPTTTSEKDPALKSDPVAPVVCLSFRFSDSDRRTDRRFLKTASDTDLGTFIESSDAFLEAIGLPSLEAYELFQPTGNVPADKYPAVLVVFAEEDTRLPVPLMSVGFPRKDIKKTGQALGEFAELCEGRRCVVHVRVVQE